jgi:serine phosphatase RsbU (regulator of sigma subunit)
VTLLHLELDGGTGRVDYVDAGHGLGLLIEPGGAWKRLVSSGPPLGLVPGASWISSDVSLEPGSSLALLSDGLLDSFTGVDEAFDAVADAVERSSRAQESVDAILDLAETAEDDVTAVVLTRGR